MNPTPAQISAAVERRLERLFGAVDGSGLDGIFPARPAPVLLDCVRDLTLRGGKRLRAAFVYGGALLFDPGAAGRPAVCDAAAAMELLHTYFLIHDDIMDGDATRRGGPSAHVALAAATGDEKTGRDLAILAGDLASSLHERLVAGLDAPEDRRREAARLFARMHADVIHGQTLDLLGGAEPAEVAAHKTASYTTVGPIAIGAALGGAGPGDIERLAGIARPIGVAFQISDDVIGAFGDPAVTGKPQGSDLRAGKRTGLLRLALGRADAGQRAAIEGALGRGADADAAAVAAAVSALAGTGAREACEAEASALLSGAIAALERGGFDPGGTAMIAHLARLAVLRDR